MCAGSKDRPKVTVPTASPGCAHPGRSDGRIPAAWITERCRFARLPDIRRRPIPPPCFGNDSPLSAKLFPRCVVQASEPCTVKNTKQSRQGGGGAGSRVLTRAAPVLAGIQTALSALDDQRKVNYDEVQQRIYTHRTH